MIIAVLLLVLWTSSASGQEGGFRAPSAAELAEARAACEQLAAMPNPPLSAEACRAMIGTLTQFEAAASDPSAKRPGDQAMTCTAIFAELTTLAGVGISTESAGHAAAIVTESQALAERQAGELTAFIGESSATGLLSGAVGAFTPNFVGAAIAAAWQARMVALGARHAAEQAPVRARTSQAIKLAMDDLDKSLRAQPRFGRLVQLALAKECEPPEQAQK